MWKAILAVIGLSSSTVMAQGLDIAAVQDIVPKVVLLTQIHYLPYLVASDDESIKITQSQLIALTQLCTQLESLEDLTKDAANTKVNELKAVLTEAQSAFLSKTLGDRKESDPAMQRNDTRILLERVQAKLAFNPFKPGEFGYQKLTKLRAALQKKRG